ncbi:hypothetical protein D3C80_995050 [compost metagenome]
MRAPRQRPHFVSHYRKATPLLTSPRRLDSGIKRQEVGLLSDVTNHRHYGADSLAGITQLPGKRSDLLKKLCVLRNCLTQTHHCRLSLCHGQIALSRDLSGLPRIESNLFNRSRHLLHRGSQLTDLVTLGIHYRPGGTAVLLQFLGGALQFLAGALDLRH